MTTLAKDTARDYELGNVSEYPMVANDIIYEGAAVGLSSGNARPLVALDVFLGFCEQNADNTGGSAGDKRVRIKKRGAVKLTVAGLSATSVLAKVYASDDDTFTLTATNNTYIGRVLEFVSTGVAVVEFDATAAPVA